MSLARGLDYYTGIIYEAITEASAPPSKPVNPPVPAPGTVTDSVPSSSSSSSKTPAHKSKSTATTSDEPDESSVGVGSIAAGGRYDNLVGMFSAAAGRKADQVPCVGISFGVERVYSILEMKRKAQQKEGKVRGKETEVYVLALGGGLVKERMGFAKMLRDNGIKVSLDGRWGCLELSTVL